MVCEIAAGHLANTEKVAQVLREAMGHLTATNSRKLRESCKKLGESRGSEAVRVFDASGALIAGNIDVTDPLDDASVGKDVSRRRNVRELNVFIHKVARDGDRGSGNFERYFGGFVRQFCTQGSRSYARVEDSEFLQQLEQVRLIESRRRNAGDNIAAIDKTMNYSSVQKPAELRIAD